MKRKKLVGLLEQCDAFELPNIRLEQYITPPEIAASLVCAVEEKLAESAVLDLGSGTGVLSAAAALAGAGHVLGVEIDEAAVGTASENAEQLDLDNVHFVQHLSKWATGLGVKMEVVAELRYDLPATYAFHKNKSRDIAVDFVKFAKSFDCRNFVGF